MYEIRGLCLRPRMFWNERDKGLNQYIFSIDSKCYENVRNPTESAEESYEISGELYEILRICSEIVNAKPAPVENPHSSPLRV